MGDRNDDGRPPGGGALAPRGPFTRALAEPTDEAVAEAHRRAREVLTREVERHGGADRVGLGHDLTDGWVELAWIHATTRRSSAPPPIDGDGDGEALTVDGEAREIKPALAGLVADGEDVDALVATNLRRFVTEQHRRADALGYKVYDVVQASVLSLITCDPPGLCVRRGDREVRGEVALRNGTVLAPPGAPADAPRLGESEWADALRERPAWRRLAWRVRAHADAGCREAVAAAVASVAARGGEFAFGDVVGAFKRLVAETPFDPDAALLPLVDDFFFDEVVTQVELLERREILRGAVAVDGALVSPRVARALRVFAGAGLDPAAARPLSAREAQAHFADRARRGLVEDVRRRPTDKRRADFGIALEGFFAAIAARGGGCSIGALVEALVALAPAEARERSALDELRHFCGAQPAPRHGGCDAVLARLAETRGHAAVRARRATLLRQVCGAVAPAGPCAGSLDEVERLTAADVAALSSLCARLGMRKQTLHDDLTLLAALL